MGDAETLVGVVLLLLVVVMVVGVVGEVFYGTSSNKAPSRLPRSPSLSPLRRLPVATRLYPSFTDGSNPVGGNKEWSVAWLLYQRMAAVQ